MSLSEGPYFNIVLRERVRKAHQYTDSPNVAMSRPTKCPTRTGPATSHSIEQSPFIKSLSTLHMNFRKNTYARESTTNQ